MSHLSVCHTPGYVMKFCFYQQIPLSRNFYQHLGAFCRPLKRTEEPSYTKIIFCAIVSRFKVVFLQSSVLRHYLFTIQLRIIRLFSSGSLQGSYTWDDDESHKSLQQRNLLYCNLFTIISKMVSPLVYRYFNLYVAHFLFYYHFHMVM